jgi:hypothetical protein
MSMICYNIVASCSTWNSFSPPRSSQLFQWCHIYVNSIGDHSNAYIIEISAKRSFILNICFHNRTVCNENVSFISQDLRKT